jgi:hypothetical protein
MTGRLSLLAASALACAVACTPDAPRAPSAPEARAAPSPTEVTPTPAATDFTQPSPGVLPPAGTATLLPFDRAAYSGACPASIRDATMGTSPNGWSCLSYVAGVMHMCVGTEEPVQGGGDLNAYARTAIEGMGPAGIHMRERRDVVLAGEPAVRLVYDDPGAPGRFVSYLFARSGQGYTATCTAAPPDTFDASLPDFEAALQSIRFH